MTNEELRREKRLLAKNAGKLAFLDEEFLAADVCRPLRVALEFLKPERAFELQNVESTFAIFGSARTLSPDVAMARLQEAAKEAADSPSEESRRKLQEAEDLEKQSRYYATARELAFLATRASMRRNRNKRTFVVVTGGGGGIMEAANRGASEAGGMTAALNITLPFEQHPNAYITPELGFQFHYFSIRKMHFLKRAKAMAFFPGGFGTMDECFEALTLVQTGKIPRVPLLLYGREYWEKLIHWQTFVDRGMVSKEDLDLFQYCETAQEGLDCIVKFYLGQNTQE